MIYIGFRFADNLWGDGIDIGKVADRENGRWVVEWSNGEITEETEETIDCMIKGTP